MEKSNTGTGNIEWERTILPNDRISYWKTQQRNNIVDQCGMSKWIKKDSQTRRKESI